MKTVHLLVAFTVLLSACKSTNAVAPPLGPEVSPQRGSAVAPPASVAEHLPFHTVARGALSGCADPAIEIVRDLDQWRELCRRPNTEIVLPFPPLPDVDWSREMVVSAALGNSKGSEIDITQVTLVEGVMHVVAVERKPSRPVDMDERFPHQPYHMIAVARHDGVVRLDLR